MPRVVFRPGAWHEVNQQLEWQEERAGLEVAERFLNNLSSSCDELARMPRMAPLCGFHRRALRQVRRWPVHGFENWLIFYREKRDGVEVIHVIHGARDIESLLGG